MVTYIQVTRNVSNKMRLQGRYMGRSSTKDKNLPVKSHRFREI